MSDTAKPSSDAPSKRATLSAILVVIGDVLCALGLFMLACFVAGVLSRVFPVDDPNLYVVWFTLGMIPFALFAHWRGAWTLNWRSIVPMAPLLLILPFVPMSITDGPGRVVLFVLVIVCCYRCGDWLMKLTGDGTKK